MCRKRCGSSSHALLINLEYATVGIPSIFGPMSKWHVKCPIIIAARWDKTEMAGWLIENRLDLVSCRVGNATFKGLHAIFVASNVI